MQGLQGLHGFLTAAAQGLQGLAAQGLQGLQAAICTTPSAAWLAAKGSARGNVPGTDQRHAMAYASTVDLDEAYRAGQTAAHLAAASSMKSIKLSINIKNRMKKPRAVRK